VSAFNPLPWREGNIRGGGNTISTGTGKIAQRLRKRPTDAEKKLWMHLRAKQLSGMKFRRQQPVGKYIVDFMCFERRVIIEVDGGQHSEEVDFTREEYLRAQGFEVLRFWNNEVLQNIEGVLETIGRRCLLHPPPAPPVKGGE